MPINKSGIVRKSKAVPATGTHCSISLQNLVPKGWAPQPEIEGMPFKLLPLEIALPEEYTVPLAHKHYEAMQNQLCQWIRAGGHDAITVSVNARLTMQEFG